MPIVRELAKDMEGKKSCQEKVGFTYYPTHQADNDLFNQCKSGLRGRKNVTDSSLDSLRIDEIRCQRLQAKSLV